MSMLAWLWLGLLVAAGPGDPDDALELDFAYGVAPRLMERGCSAAECHGGATGRGGFRLSLFGTDPQADWRAIVAEGRGRRIDAAAPERSLLLRKSTRRVAHGGGRRLDGDGEAYASLRRWIEAGTPRVGPRGPLRLRELRLERRGDRLIAWASFETSGGEGFEQDVSDRCLYVSTDESVVRVGRGGALEDGADGHAWLLARYGRASARWPVLRRGGENVEIPAPSSAGAGSRWRERLELLGIAPAPRAEDHELCRRLHLVLVGRPPRPEELRRWRAREPARRMVDGVDELLAGTEWHEEWARRLQVLLELPPAHEDAEHQRAARQALRARIRQVVADDALSGYYREALGDPAGHPLLRRLPDPRDRAEFVARAMLGTRLGCARCHDHPDDRWTQSQHLGFSACFADAPRGSEGMSVGRLFHPDDGRAVDPALLPIASDASATSTTLVEWFEGPARELAARHLANWVFAEVMGRGIVHPVGDHRLSNPALHEPVLERLAAQVSAVDFSLRATLRMVLTGPWFVRSSAPVHGDGRPDPDFQRRIEALAAFEARPLSGSSLRRAIAAVLGHDPGSRVPPESPLALALYLQNGPLIPAALSAAGNEVEALSTFVPQPERRLEQLFELVLTRPPRAEERAIFLDGVETEEGLRELATALLGSREYGSLR